MMKWFKNFSLWRLWRFGKPINLPRMENYLQHYLKSTKKASLIQRNLIAAIIKKARVKYPFQTEDFSEAKKMYHDYYKIEGCIKDLDEVMQKMKHHSVYVARFSDKMAVRGKKYESYYINSFCNTQNQTYKCGEVYKNKDMKTHHLSQEIYRFDLDHEEIRWIELAGPDGRHQHVSLKPEMFTGYRYATDKEIDKFKKRESKIKELQKVLNYHQKEKEKLYKKISKLNEITDAKKDK